MNKPFTDPEGEAGPLDRSFFTRARRGRPALPEAARKRRVNLMLDPEVVERLKREGNMSAQANALLRKALGV